MPWTFGDDSRADARWLLFLTDRFLPTADRNRLLRAGITPEALLAGETLDVGVSNVHLDPLRRALDTVSAAGVVNGIDPQQAVQLLTVTDQGFPPLLSACTDAPTALFVVGDLAVLDTAMVAVVGSRRSSLDGAQLARGFARELARVGLSIASGLALGIDGSAHRGALDAGGLTCAVLPTGVDRVYPQRHRSLAQDIARSGVVVSEFPPGTSPERFRFPRRNHTLSGLCLGTLVIEAGLPSGSLITAGAAASQGREVMALPWSVLHEPAAGNRSLLADGATLVQEPRDVLLALGAGVRQDPAVAAQPVQRQQAGREQHPLLILLGDGEHSLEHLGAACGLSSAQLLQQLALLELDGRVQRTALGYRARR